MAFSQALGKKSVQEGGYVVEEGTFSLAGVTTGGITPDATTAPKMVRIEKVELLTSDGDHVIAQDLTTPTNLKITGTLGDTGKYRISGKGA